MISYRRLGLLTAALMLTILSAGFMIMMRLDQASTFTLYHDNVGADETGAIAFIIIAGACLGLGTMEG